MFLSRGIYSFTKPIIFFQERCSTEWENKCETRNVEECLPGYGGEAAGGGCRTVPKETCSSVAVPNCRQIADELVTYYSNTEFPA